MSATRDSRSHLFSSDSLWIGASSFTHWHETHKGLEGAFHPGCKQRDTLWAVQWLKGWSAFYYRHELKNLKMSVMKESLLLGWMSSFTSYLPLIEATEPYLSWTLDFISNFNQLVINTTNIFGVFTTRGTSFLMLGKQWWLGYSPGLPWAHTQKRKTSHPRLL